MSTIFGKTIDKKQQKKFILVFLLLAAGVAYFFLVYLPQEKQKKELEARIQADIDKLQTIQPQDYATLSITLQNYSQLTNGEEWEQAVLTEKQEVLNQSIQWLQEAQEKEAEREAREKDLEAEKKTKEQEETKRKEQQMIKEKRFHWLREAKSWADDWLVTDREKYNSSVLEKGIEKSSSFNAFAHYKIHFPPALWNDLNEEQKELAQEKGHGELTLDEDTKNFEFNDEITDWEDKVTNDPVRGRANSNTKKDNNALFYGTEGTGKTSIVRRICYNTDCYPLIEIKGSTLSPNKLDSDLGIAPLEKFILTICDVEHILEDDFGFEREENGEVRYILFVDEADLVSREARFFDPIKLAFLKECMEQVSREKQTENLWIFATNHLDLIERAVYRPGRLSNPLDFSWTLGDFMRYARKAGISTQFPAHWLENPVLNQEDNKWINRFNLMSFETYFLGKKINRELISDGVDFWNKFIRHPDTQKALKEEKETNEQGEEIVKKKGIQWGEFFEFFWNLKDTGQLPHFEGKFVPPKPPKIEEVVQQSLEKTLAKIDETLSTRLQEANERVSQIREELEASGRNYTGTINLGITQITQILTEIGRQVAGNRGRNRSPNW